MQGEEIAEVCVIKTKISGFDLVFPNSFLLEGSDRRRA